MPSPRRRAGRSYTPLLVIGVLVLAAGAGAGTYVVLGHVGAEWAGAKATASPPVTLSEAPTTLSPSPTAAPTRTATPTYAATGSDTYVFAEGHSEVFGVAGTLRGYRVAIETGTPVPIEEFSEMVDTTLSDPRSWIAGENVRLQRVPRTAAAYNFTIYLVTPGTAQKYCLAGGYDIFWRGEPYTSCRVGPRVIINIARYLKSVPNYGAPIDDYRRYAINHEVGHALGHGHELCPGKGKLAPVMQQQTFDLQGCKAYFWPYKDGKRYSGPSGRIVPSG